MRPNANADVIGSAREASEPWRGSPYYDRAEARIGMWWDEGSLFREMFDVLDLSHVVELACGHGRHTEQIKDRAGRITMMDILEDNVAFCRKRFDDAGNVTTLVNNGVDFQPIEANTVTAIFCYDAMVHFPPEVVESYLRDAGRILVPGGRALFQHSNYAAGAQHYGRNPHARNFMTQELFAGFVARTPMTIERSHVLDWGGVPALDCLSLLVKR
jgi:ubiquinone/menaquinone biosynthesis C-methylase UbiE